MAAMSCRVGAPLWQIRLQYRPAVLAGVRASPMLRGGHVVGVFTSAWDESAGRLRGVGVARVWPGNVQCEEAGGARHRLSRSAGVANRPRWPWRIDIAIGIACDRTHGSVLTSPILQLQLMPSFSVPGPVQRADNATPPRGWRGT